MDLVPGIPHTDFDFAIWEDGTGENPRPWEPYTFEAFDDVLTNTLRLAEDQAYSSYYIGRARPPPPINHVWMRKVALLKPLVFDESGKLLIKAYKQYLSWVRSNSPSIKEQWQRYYRSKYYSSARIRQPIKNAGVQYWVATEYFNNPIV